MRGCRRSPEEIVPAVAVYVKPNGFHIDVPAIRSGKVYLGVAVVGQIATKGGEKFHRRALRNPVIDSSNCNGLRGHGMSAHCWGLIVLQEFKTLRSEGDIPESQAWRWWAIVADNHHIGF